MDTFRLAGLINGDGDENSLVIYKPKYFIYNVEISRTLHVCMFISRLIDLDYYHKIPNEIAFNKIHLTIIIVFNKVSYH